MNRICLVSPAAIFLALSLGVPAFADGPHARAPHGPGVGSAPETGRAVPRAAAPQAGRVAPSFGAPQSPVAPSDVRRPPVVTPPVVVVPRVVVSPRVVERPRVVVVRPFYRPYDQFRPRVRLGFGLWVGYPVVYPYYYYPYPYPYPYPYAYPPPYPYPYGYPEPAAAPSYPAPGTIGVPPGEWATTGGLSFEITPDTASIYVDGEYVGTVANFSPMMPPLWLAQGRHYIEVRAVGYESLLFDADVVGGQVIPYQGAMRPR